MKGKRFVTLFPLSYNVHLLKDVGMIPFCLYRDYGYDATLVCFKNEEAYPALEREVKGLKLQFLPKEANYSFGKFSKHVISYLKENAKAIDILNLYHNTKETLLYGLVYKLFNPKGILYIKSDINIKKFDAQKVQWVHPLRLRGYNWYFKHIADIVSCELPFVQEYLRMEIPVLKDKLILVTNGLDDKTVVKAGIRLFSYQEKENLIITVSRIGSPEKNNEYLIRAAAQADLKDWKVVLIGPVEPAFRQWLEQFLQQHPQLQDKVVLTGNISDRKELYNWYNRAKVFCLTSLFESFGLVFTEALYFGNYIVSTEVDSIDYITDSGRLGKTVRSEAELARIFTAIIRGDLDISRCYESIVAHSEKFRWTHNLKVLDERIRAFYFNHL